MMLPGRVVRTTVFAMVVAPGRRQSLLSTFHSTEYRMPSEPATVSTRRFTEPYGAR